MPVIMLMTACVEIEGNLWIIENRSSPKIYFNVSDQYPDTLLPQTNKYVVPLNPNSENVDRCSRKWEIQFSREYPKDTMTIFFFDAYTIEKTDWDIVRRDYKILERRIYSKQDLIESDWRIVYP